MLVNLRPLLPPDPALAAPELIAFGSSPTNGPKPLLQWCALTGAASYTAEYDDDWSFGSPTTLTGLTTTQYQIPSVLSDGTYYWRVRGHSGSVDGAWSATDSFVIIPLFSTTALAALVAAMVGYILWRR